jgi:hypothetical protein
VPPIPSVSENYEENQAKIAGGISTAGDTIPPVNKILQSKIQKIMLNFR